MGPINRLRVCNLFDSLIFYRSLSKIFLGKKNIETVLIHLEEIL